MKHKDRYRQHCENETAIPLFSRDWWLDAVCGENKWDVALVERAGQIIASMPYYMKNRFVFKISTMPPLTYKLGPFIKYTSNLNHYDKLSFEEDVMNELINQLPAVDCFDQNFNYETSNCLPFMWSNFQLASRYSYIIDKNKNITEIYSSFRRNIKRAIKKASEVLNIIEGNDLATFYKIHKMSFEKQKMQMPYSFNTLNRVYEACITRGCSKMLFVTDHKEQIHSVIYLIWDEDKMYAIAGGSNPNLLKSGAMCFLLFESIKIAIEKNLTFDFLGSHVKSIERLNRSFGARQMQYINIKKTNSMLLQFREFLLSLTGR